ncbi:MAG: sigma-70 region 4 domain-containing protein [Selenomonadaceae bacterium]|nr:sigma-70 region 4 domain-containing protein [Selenomonadaceae bacterium]
MNYRYNDYMKLTKEYLRNLGYYKEAERNISGEIQAIAHELGGVSINSALAGGEVHGGSSELNGVEREAERRVKQEKRYGELLLERQSLQEQIDKLERALMALPPTEKDIVAMFYMSHMSYADMAVSLNFSERTLKRRVSDATRSVAYMLFGDRANRSIEFIQ